MRIESIQAVNWRAAEIPFTYRHDTLQRSNDRTVRSVYEIVADKRPHPAELAVALSLG